ncbi:MAG: zinc ribbon domain-containing protein, partial [Acidimicrobiia bacterium]|nr:zinc ribbon domain-containing protein [Acidimicrobiia bacterium]
MNACVGCGHELSDDARFCSQCGLPVAATIRGRDLLDHQGADGWLLAPSSVARTPQRRGVLGRVAIGLLVLAIGFVAYLLYRSPATPIEEATDGL